MEGIRLFLPRVCATWAHIPTCLAWVCMLCQSQSHGWRSGEAERVYSEHFTAQYVTSFAHAPVRDDVRASSSRYASVRITEDFPLAARTG